MAEKITKTPEALAAEREQIEKMRGEIKALCNKAPPAVLSGSYQAAVAWKKAAYDAYKLACSKSRHSASWSMPALQCRSQQTRSATHESPPTDG